VQSLRISSLTLVASRSFRQIDGIVSQQLGDSLEACRPQGDNHAELGQMAAQGIDQLCALADKALVRPESDGARLMLRALDRHVVQVRPQHRFGNRCGISGISGIVLLSLDERLHGDRRDQPDFVPNALREPAPIVAGGSGFHCYDAGRLRFQQMFQLRSRNHAIV